MAGANLSTVDFTQQRVLLTAPDGESSPTEVWLDGAVLRVLALKGFVKISFEAEAPSNTNQLWYDQGVSPGGSPGTFKAFDTDTQTWVTATPETVVSFLSVFPRNKIWTQSDNPEATNPAEVQDGDIWRDGNDIYMRFARDDVGSVWIDWHVGGIKADDVIAKIDTALGNAFWRTRHGLSISWLVENWTTATEYNINDALHYAGNAYICIQAHTSGAESEPNSGGSWTDYWDLLASQGATGPGSGDLLAANNLSEIASPAGARINLGLGTIAIEDAPAGDIVGTTDVQTLSDKTLTAPTITSPTITEYVLDEDDFATDSETLPPSQKSVKAYTDSRIIDEDDFASDSTTRAPSQQSVDAYLTANVARGDAVQSLSAAYKAQARENIDAASVAAMAQQNILVNGFHQISQEHGDTAIAGITGGSDFITDQWSTEVIGAAVLTAERDQDAPDGITDSLKVTVTTADASLASGDYCIIGQKIEQSRVRRLGLGTSGAIASTLGFWVKSSTTGTISATIRNWTGSVSDYSWIQDFTIDSSNTWEFKTATIPAQTSGTWGAAVNGRAANLIITFAAGANAQGSEGWQSADKFATSSTSNFLASTSTTFQITGAFWLPGDQVPSEADAVLLQRHYDDERMLCWRYFQTMDSQATAVKDVGFGDTRMAIQLHTPMRDSPSISITAGGLASHHNNAPTLRTAGVDFAGFLWTGSDMRDGALGNITFSANARM
jgi:hypothetical protein